MKPGRNDPCPCGSGRKYKQCCGQAAAPSAAAAAPRQPSAIIAQPPHAQSAPAAHASAGQLAALLQQGRFPELEQRARGLIARQPNDGAAWKALAVALQMQSKLALAEARRAAELLPSDAEVHYNLGLALLDADLLEDAAGSLRRALALAAGYVPAQLALGGTLQRLGHISEAAACYRRVLAANPAHAEVHCNLGLAWRQLGRPQEAESSYRRAIELQPELLVAHINLADLLRSLGRMQEAAEEFSGALRLNPRVAESHAGLGCALMGLGRYAEAAESLRRAIELKPRLAEVHSSLGHALRQLGQPQQALESCRRALELDPTLAAAHGNLGNALVDLQRLGEAEGSYRRALALEPDRAEVHSNLAKVLLELGRVEESVSSAERALQLNPQLAAAHENLANALLNVNLDAAVAHYRAALQSQPDDAALHNSLGIALRLLGRTAEAEASSQRARELAPGYAPAVAALAEARADRGDFTGAERLFKEAVALEPDLSDAWVGMSRLRKFTRADAAWLEQAERLADRSGRPREVAALRYAIGKYHDEVGDYERAFASYRRANEISRQHARPYDREQVSRQFDSLIADSGRPLEPVAGAIATDRPVLIVGMPRSGTSLAEQILSSHPAVYGAGELSFWHSASARLRAAGTVDDGAIRQLGADYGRLLEHMSAGAARVIDKMPTNFLELGLICRALRGVRIIHMRRDPIDTCLSIYFQDFRSTIAYANDLDDLAHFYLEYDRLMQHWGRSLPADLLLEVPYEGLVAEQEAWTRRMLDFLNLPWDAQCLEFHRTERSVVTASKWQVRQPISGASVARWRRYESHIAPLLRLPALLEARTARFDA